MRYYTQSSVVTQPNSILQKGVYNAKNVYIVEVQTLSDGGRRLGSIDDGRAEQYIILAAHKRR